MAAQLTERLPTLTLDEVWQVRLAKAKPMPLVYVGSKGLREPAPAVAANAFAGEALLQLIATMVVTMRRAPGVGLAAPQIGVQLAVAVLEDPAPAEHGGNEAHNQVRGRSTLPLCVMINPQVRRIKGAGDANFDEGCLSVPHYAAQVRRDLRVEVQGIDAAGEPFVWRPSGWPARIVQHEVDHLRGVLYVDRMASKTLSYLPP